MPHDPYGDAADPRAAQDAAWREIVENFGERALLGDEPVVAEETGVDVDDAIARADTPSPAPAPDPRPAEEHYVPPPPPPVPSAEPHRLLAWLGLLGVPVLVLLAVVVQVPVPSWMGLMAMAWFVGGFVYLVASMHSGPRDDGDDGAVV